MKIKKIVTDPNPVLRTPCTDLESFDSEVQERVRKMFKLMYRTGHGVGLAAPQVGWSVRLFVMNPDVHTCRPQEEKIFWNPEIVGFHGEKVLMKEGCLSAPGKWGKVLRYPSVTMKAMSPMGPVEETFTELAAQIVQHEVGHLNGQMCIDLFEKEESDGQEAEGEKEDSIGDSMDCSED